MNKTRAISALAIVTLGTLAVVGCGDKTVSEPKGGTSSHLEGDDSNPGGDPGGDDSTRNAGDDRAVGGDDRLASADDMQGDNQQVAFAPAVYIAFIVAAAVVGAIATCSAANQRCIENANMAQCPEGTSAQASTATATCVGNVLTGNVDLSCTVACKANPTG